MRAFAKLGDTIGGGALHSTANAYGFNNPNLTIPIGSSLVASWMVIAVLMRVSDTARRPAPQPIQDEGMTQVVRAL